MQYNKTLNTIANLINTKIGSVAAELGCDEQELISYIELARSRNDKPIRALKSWKRFKVNIDKHKEDLFRLLQPEISSSGIFIVYSDDVIIDSTNLVPMGGWIRTSFLEKLYSNCIFETKNTNYILVGEGREEEISLSELYSLYTLH